MLSRYEEYLLLFKRRFRALCRPAKFGTSTQILEQPLVDQWVAKFANLLQQDFPEIGARKSQERFMPLVEVVSPFTQIQIRANGLEWVKALTQLNFWALVEQPLVLLGFLKDP